MRVTALASALLLAGCAGEAETWEPPVSERAAPLVVEHPALEGTPRGILGGYEHGRVWGWAQVVGSPDPVTIQIDVDGHPVATVVADQLRRDLLAKGLHPTGHAGFELLVDPLVDPLERGAEIDAHIVETDTPLTHGPCVVQGDQGVTSCTEGQPRGILGGYRDGRVWGWAHIQGDPTPVEVRIEIDGDPVTTVLADRHRPDLVEKRLHPTGDAGFVAEIDSMRRDATVAAYVVGEGYRLMRGTGVMAR